VASGAFATWDRDAGVGLDRAVASSCAVPGVYPPATINGRRYIDGAVRAATNADLARGYNAVLFVSVTMSGMNAMPVRSASGRLLRCRRRRGTLKRGRRAPHDVMWFIYFDSHRVIWNF
jgi:NTE family protein